MIQFNESSLNIQLGFVAFGFHPAAALGGFAFAHEFDEHFTGGFTAVLGDMHAQQAAGVGVHGGVFELVGVHFAQAFEAADGILVFAQALFAQFFQDAFKLGLVEGVEFAGGFFPALGGYVHAEQRRLGNVDVAAPDEFGEMAVEEGEQQHLDMRAVDVGIGEDGDFAVAQAGEVGAVAFAVRVDADGRGALRSC